MLVLLVGAVATLLTALQLRDANAARDASRLRVEANQAVSVLKQRMEGHSALLRGTAGLFAGSSSVSASEFSAYVGRLGLGSHYPGVLGIGYAARVVGEPAREALEAEMRRQGVAGFHVWPAGPRPVYTSIVYISPLAGNVGAIGFDMLTEPTRREAMTRAAAADDLAMSGPVKLVQDARGTQPGVLMYLPVRRGDGRGPGRLQGFIYSPLRAGDLLQPVFPASPDRLVDVSIYDGAVGRRTLLYETAPPSGPSDRLTTERVLSVADRPWVVVVRARPAFEAGSNRSLVYWTAWLGAAVTLALTLAVLMQARAALLAEQARMELRAVNASLEDRVARRTGELASAVADLRDEMIRREAAETQMRQMQKMEAIGQLTGGIAHDFNNMLAIVVGSLDMARRRMSGSEDPRIGHYIDNAVEGARRAAALTGRLLAFARRQRLDPEPLDVNRQVDGMTELLRRSLGEKVKVETALADGLWPVHADAAELENALLNVAVNARDAMPDGGSLTLATANVAGPVADDPDGPTSGEYVAIRIEDTGVGMAPEVIDRAFEPFFTTKEVGKGTGLGLSQVYGFVSQSGGCVSLRSAVGQGATLTIYLPRWVGTVAAKPPPTPVDGPLPRARDGEAVLVVEDEADVRRLSVEALRELGYAVSEASDGAEALRRLAEQPAADLLFTDIVMPGINGLQLAEQARAAKPTLKVLYTTGYARDASGAEAVQSALLRKPFTIEQLARRVRQALDEQRAA